MIKRALLNLVFVVSVAQTGQLYAAGLCSHCPQCECESCDCENGNHCDHC